MSSGARVLAALRRLSPVFPDTSDDTAAGKELTSISVALEPVADSVDAVAVELFPDTATTATIDRWERVTRTPIRTSDSIAERRTRVLAVLRRSSGARIDQLEKMLAGPLDCLTTDLLFVERLRSSIDDSLTNTLTGTFAITSTALKLDMGKPWPGVVDSTGVRLYLAISSLGTPTVTVTSPAGTVWTVSVTATAGWYANRDDFTDEAAGGKWIVSVANGSAVNLTECRLLVSNDVDSAQIYNFFAYRDPVVAGTPDITEAQRLFKRTALGHMNAHVGQSLSFKCDSPYSLCDRDPLGI